MANRSSNSPFGPMNRREMLGTSTALIGGSVAGVAANALGHGVLEAAAPPAQAGAPAVNVNLNPPVIDVKGGKLRGVREGSTYAFLGIRYAEAERFGPPRPVQA
jgi:para-nitrobenzyl esterase